MNNYYLGFFGIVDENYFDPKIRQAVHFIKTYFEQYKAPPKAEQVNAEMDTPKQFNDHPLTVGEIIGFRLAGRRQPARPYDFTVHRAEAFTNATTVTADRLGIDARRAPAIGVDISAIDLRRRVRTHIAWISDSPVGMLGANEGLAGSFHRGADTTA